MAKVLGRHLRKLRPYFEFQEGDVEGEVGMHCPLHSDSTRSSSLNTEHDLWYCQVCEVGMSADELVAIMEHQPEDVFPPPDEPSGRSQRHSSGYSAVLPNEGSISGWCSRLLSDRQLTKKMQRKRGLSVQTLQDFQIGWDDRTRAFTIPVRDRAGELINVRRYQLDPTDNRRKIWSVKGHGSPMIYPMQILLGDPSEIVICEGEWDALLCIQNGFMAVTRTGPADSWRDSWSKWFKGKCVFVCHDADNKGQKANSELAKKLAPIAKDIGIVILPYETLEKHGKDITDYFHLDNHSAEDFQGLLQSSLPKDSAGLPVSIMDSFGADVVGKPVRIRATITGKRENSYALPRVADLMCNQSAGPKCVGCPMNEQEGRLEGFQVRPDDSMILHMINSPESALLDAIRDNQGIHKCHQLKMLVIEYQTVEEIFVRPAVDQETTGEVIGESSVGRKVVSVGRHDSTPNTTVSITGIVFPHPKTQTSELQAFSVVKTETALELYQPTPTGVALMEKFQSRQNRPLRKLFRISEDLSRHVTKIYGRRNLHALIDLAWHSVIAFPFDGALQTKGWLDVLVVGDTRTGKSEVARNLSRFYGAGEVVSCESASFAGVVGGLHTVGDKDWQTAWGAIPLNDRRLVVLDEVSGFRQEDIARMSEIRSSGVASLTKIRQDKTSARTRLVWLSNPRDGGRMSAYMHGVQAISPLIGNNEDIARFDLAMTVSADEVSSESINKKVDPSRTRTQAYSAESCRELLSWVWSRKPEQVIWEAKAEDLVYQIANKLGDTYIEDPPLIQAASVRHKIARVAVALAGRTFSTDSSHEMLLVTNQHVRAADEFIELLYGAEGFGYLRHSKDAQGDRQDMYDQWGPAKHFLKENPALVRLLVGADGDVRVKDIQETMNLDLESASGIMSKLWEFKLVERKKGVSWLRPELQAMLREIKNKGDT